MKWAKYIDDVWDFRVKDIKKYTVTEAAQHTIESIINEYPPPYNLMVSGGVDSQAMLYLWSKYGTDFIPYTVRYNGDMNEHDIYDSSKTEPQYPFLVQYIDFDILQYYKTEAHDYAHRYRCSSPCITAHIKMSEGLKGTTIFSGDFVLGKHVVLSNAILGLYRASQLDRPNLIPYFFLHTPELAYSLAMNTPLDLFMTQDPLHPNYNKSLIYKHNDLIVTPQIKKTTGFEKIKDYYDQHYRNTVPIGQRFKYAKKPSKRTFDILFRHPYEDLYDIVPFKYLTNNFIS